MTDQTPAGRLRRFLAAEQAEGAPGDAAPLFDDEDLTYGDLRTLLAEHRQFATELDHAHEATNALGRRARAAEAERNELRHYLAGVPSIEWGIHFRFPEVDHVVGYPEEHARLVASTVSARTGRHTLVHRHVLRSPESTIGPWIEGEPKTVPDAPQSPQDAPTIPSATNETDERQFEPQQAAQRLDTHKLEAIRRGFRNTWAQAHAELLITEIERLNTEVEQLQVELGHAIADDEDEDQDDDYPGGFLDPQHYEDDQDDFVELGYSEEGPF